MELYLMNFKKRINSTKIPLLSSKPYNIVLKETTDLMHPSFILKERLDTANSFNYAFFMGRYYWIDKIISLSNSNVEIQCSVDALATFRTDIMQSTQYVVYATGGTTDILDSRMMLNNMTTRERSIHDVEAFDYNGIFLLSVVGQGSPVTGFADTFAFLPTQIMYFARQLAKDDFPTQLEKFFRNPYDSIISCVWLPLSLATVGGTENSVRIATYDTGVSASRIDNATIQSSFKLKIPLRSGNYLDLSPFTKISLFLPFYGLTDLDPQWLYGIEEITVVINIDVFTGDIAYYVNAPVGNMIATYSGNCGCQIPTASTQSYNPVGLLAGIATFTSGVATGNVMGMLGGLGETVTSIQAQHSVGGSLGSRSGSQQLTAYLEVEKKTGSEGVSAKKSVIGLPFGKTVLLSSLIGQYAQCTNASVEIDGEVEEINAVNAALNGGVYIE